MAQLDDLEEILDYTVQETEKSEPNIFRIAGFPHYEDVLSNIYAFYFDKTESHGLDFLFMRSLLNLISRKKRNGVEESAFEAIDYKVIREAISTKKGAIDLVIRDLDDSNSIIIENKVYAGLYNDLEDYYSTSKASNKIGVVMSLEEIDLSRQSNEIQKNFVNITHLEFMTEVNNNLEDYERGVNAKFLIYLNDLYQNICDMSKTEPEISENVKFYLKNADKINQLVGIKREAEQYFYDSVTPILGENNWESPRLNIETVGFKDSSGCIVGYIYFNQYFSKEKKLKFEFWIKGVESVNNWNKGRYEEFQKKCPNLSPEIEFPQQSEGKEWKMIAIRTIDVGDGLNFVGLINNELSTTWKKVREVIKPLIK